MLLKTALPRGTGVHFGGRQKAVLENGPGVINTPPSQEEALSLNCHQQCHNFTTFLQKAQGFSIHLNSKATFSLCSIFPNVTDVINGVLMTILLFNR